LGMCHAANAGCFQALRTGVASSASLMVPCPWARHAAAEYRGEDVGVHLTLNAEWPLYRWAPLTTGSSLRADDGTFSPSPSKIRRGVVWDEVRGELRAQIELALKWDIDVSHLDSHMYILEEHDELFDIYLDLAVEYALPIRMPGSVDNLADRFRARARARGVLAPDRLVPLPCMGSRAPLERALGELLPGVTEFHAHPAMDTPELRAIAPDWARRVDDHKLLCEDEGFKAMLERSGAVVIGYRALKDIMRAG
ncbi:MAG: ChbG/HpnK family deacetylase, partial [Opitutae bacterium]|nr:ChbG/HpnK family deacetylase [Opitutae bacterium]